MDKNMKFEEAVNKLEEIVRALEDGNTPLDRALKLYENGIALVRFCNEKLDSAEQKINMLVSGEDGKMTKTPFEAE
jgi:exodeoxyribonuclease VII small subunit